MFGELKISGEKMLSLHDGSLFMAVIMTVKGWSEESGGYDYFSRCHGTECQKIQLQVAFCEKYIEYKYEHSPCEVIFSYLQFAFM